MLDEPTAHLDRVTAREVIDDLLGALDGRSIVLISHDRDVSLVGREYLVDGGRMTVVT